MKYYIESTKNEKYKFYKSLKLKKSRNESGLYTVEGIKSVRDAVECGVFFQSIIVSERFERSVKFDYPKCDIFVVSDDHFDALASTETPQGIIGVLFQSDLRISALDLSRAYIYCDRLQDPGNLGTIIRTADAAGFGGVLLSPESVDLYSPKTVRASMGSFFHIEKYENVTVEMLDKLRNQGFSVLCGVLCENSIEYTKVDFTKPVIIAIGNEAHGIKEDVLAISDENIKIPISGQAESLNAAIAAAILMYETHRQRSQAQ